MGFAKQKQVVQYSELDAFVEACNHISTNASFYGWKLISDDEADILSHDGNHLRVTVIGIPKNR